jgi:hypothetical protein
VKQKLLNLTTKALFCLITNFAFLIQAHSQQLDFYIDHYDATLYIVDKKSAPESSKTDTICSKSLMYDYKLSPVCCQNDSLFYVLVGFTIGFYTEYDLFVYKKNIACESAGKYTHKERRNIVVRKTSIKSVDNKIIVEFNDCGEMKSILNFDPYTMNISDARMQFIMNSRKL